MSDEKKDKPKRLLINLKPEEHKEIKQRALDRNISIKKYVLESIFNRINWEKKYE